MYTYTRPEEVSYNVEMNVVNDEDMIKSFDYKSIPRSKYYTEAMEHFDITDTMTRNVLLAVNEEDQNIVMQSLANKLYKHVVDKVDDVDFGTIPTSKGDITKIDNYDALVDCISIISDILQNYHQDTKPIETVALALQNMVDRVPLFTKAYKLNVELPMIVYNTITLSIISSVSYMISSCIEFIKEPNGGFDIAIDKVSAVKAKDCILFKDLDKFNSICANGQLDKSMEYVIQMNSKNFVDGGFGIGAGAVALGVILIIIPLMRELVFFFYYSRTKISNYFDAQATLLQMNAYNIENNLTRDDKTKKEIAKKQKSIADRFRGISNKIAINTRTGESKAVKETDKLSKEKYKTNEVLDGIPDSANSVLF